MIISFKDGIANTIYNEKFLLNDLGKLNISRASYVEPNECGEWIADMSPIKDIKLGPFKLRSEALTAEHQFLEELYLEGKL